MTATPDDPATTPSPMPVAPLVRRRMFALLERTHAELVVAREARVLDLLGAAPGTDAYIEIGRAIEALNDEIDDIREQSDELLRRVAPLELGDDQLSRLEQTLASARALASAAARAKAMLALAQELLGAIDDALDSGGA